MIPLPRWLLMLLFPVVFVGTFLLTARLLWKWQEHRLTRNVTDADSRLFPVLIRTTDGKYAVSSLAEITTDTAVVTSGFDEVAINRDLNASVGNTREYHYFRVLKSTTDSISLSLEHPVMDDHELQGWYHVTQGRIIPQKILHYFGPGLALGILGWAFLSGLILTIVFFKFVGRKRQTTPQLMNE